MCYKLIAYELEAKVDQKGLPTILAYVSPVDFEISRNVNPRQVLT